MTKILFTLGLAMLLVVFVESNAKNGFEKLWMFAGFAFMISSIPSRHFKD